jgi:uncharacterized membrane protein
MGKRAIKWLYQELPELVSKGILAQDAADKLRQYYGEVKDAGKKWTVIIICGVLGALLIGLGIILILAHNWEQLSRFTRAIISFLPLLLGQGLALWVLWRRPQSHAFKEGTATFLSLMVGASIALISQTYNINGDTGTFILTWMFLIVPLVYLMQATLPAVIYFIGITSWAGAYWNDPLMAVLFWPLAAAVVPHFIWALRRETYTIRVTIMALVMAICTSIAAGFSLGKAWSGSWMILYSSIFAIFFALGQRRFKGFSTNWQRPLRILGALGILVLAFQFTFSYVWKYIGADYYQLSQKISGMNALPDRIITFVIIALALFFLYDNVKHKKTTTALFGALPLLAIMGYSLRGQDVFLSLLIFNAYLFILSLVRIMEGIRNNSLAAINSGMLIMAILLIIRFFDSDINFILKGLVFIIIGAGFLVTNVVLVRRGGGR